MSDARHYIVGDHDVWMINSEEEECGFQASNVEAVFLAINAARKLGCQGQRAHVCVVDGKGRFRSKWTCDRDHHLRRS